jgi:membrane peptidoglycan carboxypeptidase
MGIRSPLEPVCSITLGTHEVTPLEMASAFGTLANHGVHCRPFGITKVEARGKILLRQRHGRCDQVIDRQIADDVAGLLRLVVSGGTGTAANLGQWPVFGKTGTTNDSADVWFSGCTSQVCAATWVGHPEARVPMPGAYGGTVAAPVWHDFMLVAMRGLPPKALPSTPQPEAAEVPDVVGLSKAEAIDVLVEAFFTPVIESVPATEGVDVVVGQSPSGGAAAVAGSQVVVRVSNGKAPSSKVPNVVGMTAGSASARLKNAGFRVEVGFEGTNNKKLHGRVSAQAPGPGVRLEKGATVAIDVYRYEKPKGGPPSPPPSEDAA